MANDFSFELIQHLGMISEEKSGYSKQLNRVSWNGAAEKIDIRIFNTEGRPLKGITLTEAEARKLRELLENNGF